MISSILIEEEGGRSKLEQICKELQEEVDHFDWVGFYEVDKEKEQVLSLGPYVGTPSGHVTIPFGQGVCGRVAANPRTLDVQDVSKEDNYLSCSPSVKSEIVVPIFNKNKFVAVLDIDSHILAPFTEEDKNFLETLADRLGTLFS